MGTGREVWAQVCKCGHRYAGVDTGRQVWVQVDVGTGSELWVHVDRYR